MSNQEIKQSGEHRCEQKADSREPKAVQVAWSVPVDGGAGEGAEVGQQRLEEGGWLAGIGTRSKENCLPPAEKRQRRENDDADEGTDEGDLATESTGNTGNARGSRKEREG